MLPLVCFHRGLVGTCWLVATTLALLLGISATAFGHPYKPVIVVDALPVPLDPSREVVVTGWVIDHEGWEQIALVEVQADVIVSESPLVIGQGAVGQVQLDQERADVVSQYGRADWRFSGFKCIISPSTLLPLTGRITVRAKNQRGTWSERIVAISPVEGTAKAAMRLVDVATGEGIHSSESILPNRLFTAEIDATGQSLAAAKLYLYLKSPAGGESNLSQVIATGAESRFVFGGASGFSSGATAGPWVREFAVKWAEGSRSFFLGLPAFQTKVTSQTLTFDIDPLANGSVRLAAYASSGLPVIYRVVSGPAAIDLANGSLLVPNAAGVVRVEARQIGNATWLGATLERDITVTPPSTQNTLTIVTAGNGSGSVTGGGTYATGTQLIPISATPASGSRFDGWTGATFDDGEAADTYLTQLDADTVATANFVKTANLTINIVGQGSVQGARTYDSGSADISISATAAPGWRFAGWTGSEFDDAAATQTLLTRLDQDSTITATFVRVYVVTINIVGAGTAEGAGTYDAGVLPIAVRADAGAGYDFWEWSGDIDSLDDPGSSETEIYTLDRDITLTANFHPLRTLELRVSPLTGGRAVVSGQPTNRWAGFRKAGYGGMPSFNWGNSATGVANTWQAVDVIGAGGSGVNVFPPAEAADVEWDREHVVSAFLLNGNPFHVATSKHGFVWEPGARYRFSFYARTVTGSRVIKPGITANINTDWALGGTHSINHKAWSLISFEVVAPGYGAEPRFFYTNEGGPLESQIPFMVYGLQVERLSPVLVTVIEGSSPYLIATLDSAYSFGSWTGVPVFAPQSASTSVLPFTGDQVVTANLSPLVAVSATAAPTSGGFVQIAGRPFRAGTISLAGLLPNSNHSGQPLSWTTTDGPEGQSESVIALGGRPWHALYESSRHGQAFEEGVRYGISYWARATGSGPLVVQPGLSSNVNTNWVFGGKTTVPPIWSRIEIGVPAPPPGAAPRLFLTNDNSQSSLVGSPLPIQVTDLQVVRRTPLKEYFPSGTSVTLMASTLPGYRFSGWSGPTSSTASSLTVSAAAAATYIASFVAQWTVSVAIEGAGVVDGAGVYDDGAMVRLVAAPAVGQRFVGWFSVDDELLSTSSTHDISVYANLSFVAKFEAALPTANPISVTTPEDQEATISLVTQTPPPAAAWSYVVTSGVTHGRLTGVPPDLSYQPDPNFHGLDTFSYIVREGVVDSPPGQVSITVTPVNDAPSVRLTAPQAGGGYVAPSEILLTAAVTDPDGEADIAGVAFYNGSTELVEIGSSPWVYAWAAAAPGEHVLRAEVVDLAGARGVSNSAAVRVVPDVLAVDVGADRLIALPARVTLGATIKQGDSPIDQADSYQWSGTTVAGSGVARFDDSGAARPTVSFTAPGRYTLSVAVVASALGGRDELQVEVLASDVESGRSPPSSAGYEFWTAFTPVGTRGYTQNFAFPPFDKTRYNLAISSAAQASGIITEYLDELDSAGNFVRATTRRTHFTVGPDRPLLFVPSAYGGQKDLSQADYIFALGIPRRTALHIQTDSPVSIQGIMEDPYEAAEAFPVFPSVALGTEYVIPAYPSKSQSGFALVGTEAGTSCTITLRAGLTLIGRNNQEHIGQIDVTLGKGEVIRFSAKDLAGQLADPTGTRITSSRPIAVIAGARATSIGRPSTANANFRIDESSPTEQLLPVDRWGKTFAIVPLIGPEVPVNYHTLDEDPHGGDDASLVEPQIIEKAEYYGDPVRIIAAYPDTRIAIDGLQLAVLGAGESREIDAKKPLMIFSTKPVQVAQFTRSEGSRWRQAVINRYTRDTGDIGESAGGPSMVIVPPLESYARSARFYSLDNHYENQAPGQPSHFVSLVTSRHALSTVRVDGKNVDPVVVGEFPNTDYIAARIPLSAGFHAVECDSPLMAIAWAQNRTYLIGGLDSAGKDSTYAYCPSYAIETSGEVANISLSQAPVRAILDHPYGLVMKLLDAHGLPVVGAAVSVVVSGAHPASFSVHSDARGYAYVSYFGATPPADTITPETDTITVASGTREIVHSVAWEELGQTVLPTVSLTDAPKTAPLGTETLFDSTPGSGVNVSWHVLGGTGEVGISPVNGDAGKAKITFGFPGKYVVRAVGSLAGLSVWADKVVEVHNPLTISPVTLIPPPPPPPPGQPPPAFLRMASLPDRLTLQASVAGSDAPARVDFLFSGQFVGSAPVVSGVAELSVARPGRAYSQFPFRGPLILSARGADATGVRHLSPSFSLDTPAPIVISRLQPATASPLPLDGVLTFEVGVVGGTPPYTVEIAHAANGSSYVVPLAKLTAPPYIAHWAGAGARDARTMIVNVIDSAGEKASREFDCQYYYETPTSVSVLFPGPSRILEVPFGQTPNFIVEAQGPYAQGSSYNNGESWDDAWVEFSLANSAWSAKSESPQTVGEMKAHYTVLGPPALPRGDHVFKGMFKNRRVGEGQPLPDITVRVADEPRPYVHLGPDQNLVWGAAFITPALAINPAESYTGPRIRTRYPQPIMKYEWRVLAGPEAILGSPAGLQTSVTFSTCGTYTLRLSADDGVSCSYDDIILNVTGPAGNQPPQLDPAFYQSLELPLTDGLGKGQIAIQASDPDGDAVMVDVFQRMAPFPHQHKLGSMPLPSDGVLQWPIVGYAPGVYEFSVKLRDSRGARFESSPKWVYIGSKEVIPDGAALVSPGVGAHITSPTEILGYVNFALMTGYRVELRPQGAAGSPSFPWRTICEGKAKGRKDAEVALGVLDPSLLKNGSYELRLAVDFPHPRSWTSEPILIYIEGARKVGAYSVAFRDLSIPVPGFPLEVLRRYDSRDKWGPADFGPGWSLAMDGFKLRKNRSLGADWQLIMQDIRAYDNTYYLYTLTPDTDAEGNAVRHLVSLTLPDDTLETFEAYVDVSTGGGGNAALFRRLFPGNDLTENQSFTFPITQAHIKFRPAHARGTKGTLELAEALPGWLLADASEGPVQLRTDYDFSAPVFNPTRFRYTTADGTAYIINEQDGLEAVLDANGNRLDVRRRATDRRIEAIDAIQVGDSGPIKRTLAITRHSDGRVQEIVDLASNRLSYGYDAQGRLQTFTDRVNSTTTFYYEKSDDPTHPLFHYLTRIKDANNRPALRCEYSDDGKLLKQFDADGNEVNFDRSVAGVEKIKDRLGHTTTYHYDDFGNILRKIDALDAKTDYEYYPNSDRVKFETDDAGNVKSYAYDAKGNVTVEVQGADRRADPSAPTTGYVSRTTYESFGAPRSITDPDGRQQSFTYNLHTEALETHTVGQLAPGHHPEVELAAAATTTYSYHSDGSLRTVTDALGNLTTTTYDFIHPDPRYPGAVKRVTTTVVDPAGSLGSSADNAVALTLRTTHTYHDAQENLLASVTPRKLPSGIIEEAATRYVYDAASRLRFMRLPDGRIEETRYTPTGQTAMTLEWPVGTDLTSRVAAGPGAPTTGARVTILGYDDRGNLIRTTLPDGTYTSTGYDAENRSVWQQDARGYRTFTVYDKVGRPRFTIFPDADDGVFDDAPAAADHPLLANNPRSETIYDPVGRVRFQIDEECATTEFTYEDGCGCAMRRKKMIQHHPAGNLVTTYDYYPSGQVRSVTDPRQNSTGTRYDSHGRLVRTLLPATDEHPATQTSTTYNVLGQRVAVTDQEGKITRHRHDALGRLVEVRQYLDPAIASSDANYQLPFTDPSLVSTRYTYDDAGNQTAQTDARGNVTRYEHDALGRRLKRTLPAATGAAEFEALRYDSWGDLWQRDDFAGHTTTFAYDPLHRLTSKSADSQHPSLDYSHAIARVEYDYDDNGAREAARTFNASGTPLYTETTPRDERGHVKYKDTGGGARLDYGYYTNGLLKDIVSDTSGGVNVGYRYDELNRLAYVDDASRGLPVRTTSYAYNPNGSLEALTYANGLRHAYRYDSLNRLRHLDVGTGLATGTTVTSVVQSYDYRLRAGGHRHEVAETGTTATSRLAAYAYDELYRLTAETITGDPVHSGVVSYTLDKVGNREARTSTVSGLASRSGLAFNARDQLSTDTYDPNGNTHNSDLLATRYPLLATTSVADVFDFEDRLIVRTRPDLSTVNLGYDADGLRIRKTLLDASANLVSSTSYLVCVNNLTGYAQVLEESTTTATGTSLKTYTYGHDLLSVTTQTPGSSLPASSSFFLYDGGGSVRALADATGNITDRYTYDAFGVLLEHQGTSDNAYLYRGEQWDADLGLYYLRARFMNPDSGRFWNQDTYEGSNTDPASLHKYLYAHADPVNGVDPSGNFAQIEQLSVQSIAQTVMSGLRVGVRLADIYFKASTVVDAISTVHGIFQFLSSGAFADIARTFTAVPPSGLPNWPRFGADDLVNSIRNNADDIIRYAPQWTGELVANGVKTKKGIEGVFISFPMPGSGSAIVPSIQVAKLPIGRLKLDLDVRFGNPPGVGTSIFGFGLKVGGQYRQMFRIDPGALAPTHPNRKEWGAWKDPQYPFHYHATKLYP